MLKAILPALIVVLVTACASHGGATRHSPQSAAEAFLVLIDKGNYRESWAEASTWLRNKVDAKQWAEHAGSFRQQLGTVGHRQFKSVEFHDALEEMPEGRYAFVFFDSSLADNGRASEMVGLMLDDDSMWRVIGYQTQ